MKLTILPICIISVMLAATFIISIELLKSPYETASIFDFSEHSIGGGGISFR